MPLAARTAGELRAFMVRGLLATALIFPLYFALPVVAVPRAFAPHGPLGRMLLEERALDTAAGAFPSFHVVWALLAAETLGARGSNARVVARTWGWAVAVSCLLTGMHTLIDVAAGALAALAVVRAARIWEWMRALAERAANAWREIRIGPVRVINHGVWAALAAFAGLAIIGALLGRAYAAPMLVAAGCGLVGAAVWAQLLEGSPALLRPYGFYGGLVGVILGALAAPAFGVPVWPLLGAFAVAAPVVQSLGRVRCLVQGCCHGRPAPPAIGIRYTHPRSRVCRIAHLAGEPLHPAPLYSILWNAFVLLVVARAWSLGADAALVGGVYLVLGGLGRFVEESFRGEPQTAIVARLRIYQWIAIAQVAAGALVSALARGGAAPHASWGGAPIGLAALGGLAIGCALGVDFPGSTRRFSRLA